MIVITCAPGAIELTAAQNDVFVEPQERPGTRHLVGVIGICNWTCNGIGVRKAGSEPVISWIDKARIIKYDFRGEDVVGSETRRGDEGRESLPAGGDIHSVVAYRTLRNPIADFNGICAYGSAQREYAERSPECGRETPTLGVYHIKPPRRIVALRL
jgi:hypothetical protein